jgi:UDP-N-acetylglucosamine diphosphorylase/glucosamine-1-phosphate N-acetyltransferase
MQIQFVDQDKARTRLLPLTYTRPIADLRVGILRISEKWSKMLQATSYGYDTAAYLSLKFSLAQNPTIFIYNGLLPNLQLLADINSLPAQTKLVANGKVLVSNAPIDRCDYTIEYLGEINQIVYPWDIFSQNGSEINKDFKLITANRKSEPITDPHTICYGENIFLEKGAKVKAAILNTENGPIYLGKDTEISEGAIVKGPFALCNHSVVNMGAKIKGDSTIGPYSKVGGEISNSVIQGYTNKGHDGFLGSSVVGEWCNLGADTNNSNLKNNYGNVKMWDFESESFKDTGLQFCGLIMGDHSKCGINTMFNTGTTIGVSSNIFGEGFPRTIVPSFAWGGASGFVTYKLNKVYETAELVMSRRKIQLDDIERDILQHIFNLTSENRIWEKNG